MSKCLGKFTPTLPMSFDRLEFRSLDRACNDTVKNGTRNSISVDVEVERLFHDLMARSIRSSSNCFPRQRTGYHFPEKTDVP